MSMAFGTKDGIVAYNMNRDDTRKYELAKAPLKRLLLQGIRNGGSQFRKPKVSEGLLLVFRKQVEDYALELAERIGSVSAADQRVTSKIIDLEMANNGFYIPYPTLPEPETTEPKPEPEPEIPWKAGFYEEITAEESFKLCEAFCQKALKVLTQFNSEKESGNVSDDTITAVNRLQDEAQDILDMLWKRAGIHGWPWGSVEWKENIEKARDKAGQKLQELSGSNSCGCYNGFR